MTPRFGSADNRCQRQMPQTTVEPQQATVTEVASNAKNQNGRWADWLSVALSNTGPGLQTVAQLPVSLGQKYQKVP